MVYVCFYNKTGTNVRSGNYSRITENQSAE